MVIIYYYYYINFLKLRKNTCYNNAGLVTAGRLIELLITFFKSVEVTPQYQTIPVVEVSVSGPLILSSGFANT